VPLTRLVQTDERRYGSTMLMFYKIHREIVLDGDTTTEA